MKRKKLSQGERQRVLEKCKGRCAYCGEPLIWARWQIDHVVPLHKGGKDELENMIPSCASCNHYKSTLDLEQFRDRQYTGLRRGRDWYLMQGARRQRRINFILRRAKMDKEKVKMVRSCRTCENLEKETALGYEVLVCGYNIGFGLDITGEEYCEFHEVLELEVH